MEGLQGLIDVAFYALVGVALAVSGFFFVMGVFNFMSAARRPDEDPAGHHWNAQFHHWGGAHRRRRPHHQLRRPRHHSSPAAARPAPWGRGFPATSCSARRCRPTRCRLANSDNVDLVVKEIQSREECPRRLLGPRGIRHRRAGYG